MAFLGSFGRSYFSDGVAAAPVPAVDEASDLVVELGFVPKESVVAPFAVNLAHGHTEHDRIHRGMPDTTCRHRCSYLKAASSPPWHAIVRLTPPRRRPRSQQSHRRS